MDNTIDTGAKQNELSQIKTALAELEVVKSSVEQIANIIVDRLCGPIPECDTASEDDPPSSGELCNIRKNIVKIKQGLYATLDTLKRLDRETDT